MDPGELLLPLDVLRDGDVHASEPNHALARGCLDHLGQLRDLRGCGRSSAAINFSSFLKESCVDRHSVGEAFNPCIFQLVQLFSPWTSFTLASRYMAPSPFVVADSFLHHAPILAHLTGGIRWPGLGLLRVRTTLSFEIKSTENLSLIFLWP